MFTHPGQSKVHLHLSQPLPHTGPHPNTKRDEAVRVVLIETRCGSAAVAAGRLYVQPSLRDKVLRVSELCLFVTGGVVTQVELSLATKNHKANLLRTQSRTFSSVGSSVLPFWGTSSCLQSLRSLKQSVRFRTLPDTGWRRNQINVTLSMHVVT